MQLDPEADIVTVIMDVVTDKRHFHLFVKSKGSSSITKAKVVLALTALVTCFAEANSRRRLAIRWPSGSYPVAIR